MRKAFSLQRIMLVVFVMSLALSTTGCMNAPRVHTTSVPGRHRTTATITIPHAQELFEPYILTIRPNTIVTWKNEDRMVHIFTTTPDRSTILNPRFFSLEVAAYASVTFTFTQVGLYHYYEKTVAVWNSTFSRVAATKRSSHFPLSMEGIIWVQGSLYNLPTAAVNSIPDGHDDFFQEFLAIQSPGAVTWHNFDSDSHFLGLVSGWSAPINPFNIGLYRLPGTNGVPNGDSATVYFTVPGLYYYYCRNHAEINTLSHQTQALTMSSEYPISMDGFVLVV